MARTAANTKRTTKGTKRKRGPGRRPALDITPSIRVAVCRAIELGMPIKYACARAGIGESTFHEWVGKAELGEPYAGFAESITRARAAKVEKALAIMWEGAVIPNNSTGQLDPRWAQWLMERTEGELFAPPKQKVDSTLSGPGGGPLQVNVTSWENLAALAGKEGDEK